jgi:hypothetical protein
MVLSGKEPPMPIISDQEIKVREKALIETVERVLPDFVQSCRQDNEVVVIHQDAFAADYQEEEYRLLGMAIKVAGIFGKELRIIGKNRETLKAGDKAPGATVKA